MRTPKRDNPPNVVGVGQRLRRAREATGLTQAEFARLLGEGSLRPVADRELGDIDPGVGWLHRVSMATGADIVWLLTGQGHGPPVRMKGERWEYVF